jgi:hypothetical protein
MTAAPSGEEGQDAGAKASRLPSLRSRTRDRIHLRVSGHLRWEQRRPAFATRTHVEAAPPLPTVFPASPKGRRKSDSIIVSSSAWAIGPYPRGRTVPERRGHPDASMFGYRSSPNPLATPAIWAMTRA